MKIMLQSRKKSSLAALLLCAAFLFIDQWTKCLAAIHLKGAEDVELIPHIVRFHYLQNEGAAFSIMQNKMLFFYIVTPVFCAFVLWFFLHLPLKKRFLPLWWISVALMAGALGNFIDRVRLHYVIDFIYIYAIHFPVFNIADILVTLSMICLIIAVIFVYKDEDYREIFERDKKDKKELDKKDSSYDP